MKDQENLKYPNVLKHIQAESEALNFRMASDSLTGSFLRTLAASKPAGMFLELGTGTGMSAAWLLNGMDRESKLISVDQDDKVIAVARKYLGQDRRVVFHTEDATIFLGKIAAQRFDFIFADAWVGKYSCLEDTLNLLKLGGLYVIDDMLPQAIWSEDQASKASQLISSLECRSDLTLSKINWSTGLVVAAKVRGQTAAGLPGERFFSGEMGNN
ncbi:O-methyltransferase [uncultured Nostoc sp.]|uniref:O-methyltransferase n=1 Tax=uncultured Nostoc sp. TaxID=340711 RepID=UPI0035C97659